MLTDFLFPIVPSFSTFISCFFFVNYRFPESESLPFILVCIRNGTYRPSWGLGRISNFLSFLQISGSTKLRPPLTFLSVHQRCVTGVKRTILSSTWLALSLSNTPNSPHYLKTLSPAGVSLTFLITYDNSPMESNLVVFRRLTILTRTSWVLTLMFFPKWYRAQVPTYMTPSFLTDLSTPSIRRSKVRLKVRVDRLVP